MELTLDEDEPPLVSCFKKEICSDNEKSNTVSQFIPSFTPVFPLSSVLALGSWLSLCTSAFCSGVPAQLAAGTPAVICHPITRPIY